MSTYASIDDVRARVTDDSTDERIQTYLDDLETILRVKIPDLADRVASSATDAGMLTIVIVRSLKRLLDNPAGYQGEHAGEVGYYFGSSKSVPGQLGFTRADLVDLGIKRNGPRSFRVALEPSAYAERRPA